MYLILGKLPRHRALLANLTIYSDLPNTVFTTAQAGISISPHNYLMGDPSRVMSHVMHIDKTSEVPTPEIYGGQMPTCGVDMVSTPFSYINTPLRQSTDLFFPGVIESRLERISYLRNREQMAARVHWWWRRNKECDQDLNPRVYHVLRTRYDYNHRAHLMKITHSRRS